ILMCLPLIDDGVLSRFLPKRLTASIMAAQLPPKVATPRRWKNVLVNAGAGIMILLAVGQFMRTIARPYIPPIVLEALAAVAPFHMADSYGLFAVMTTTRPEIVFEGT